MQLPAITSPLSPPFQTPAKGITAADNSTESSTTSPQLGASTDVISSERQSPLKLRQSGTKALTDADYRIIAELKRIDREVHAHEAAHLAAAGGLARGGASFGYTQGPDGQRYAINGEVSIDTSPIRDDPQATLLKAQRIQAAALAPAQPSSADRAVASSAAQMAASARAELLAKRLDPEESEGTSIESNKPETQSVHANSSSDTAETHSEKFTSAREQPSKVTEDLAQLIKQATSAGNALGNILNTAV